MGSEVWKVGASMWSLFCQRRFDQFEVVVDSCGLEMLRLVGVSKLFNSQIGGAGPV